MQRDSKRLAQSLVEQGWEVLVVWECQMKDQDALTEMLRSFIEPAGGGGRMRFEVGGSYTREDVQNLLGVPDDQRGGNWDTGYNPW